MEERNNKSNTMLLTVIAIATLLVAVIGATFAYFTASIDAETESTVLVRGTQLTINFADSNPNLELANGLVPTKLANNTYEEVTSKTFTLRSTNPSTSTLNYTLYLVIDNNTFQLKDASNHTSLTYRLESSSNGGEITGTAANTYINVPALNSTLKSGYTSYNPGTNDALLQDENDRTALIDVYLHNDDTTTNGTLAGKGLQLGQGTFAPGNLTHTYTIKLYFNENELNQDYDKGATFSGYVAIDANAITPAANDTATVLPTPGA